MNTAVKLILKIVLPLVVIVIGALGAKALIESREIPPTVEREVPVPRVRTMTPELTNYQVYVPSQGSVVPRMESELVCEVSGRVTYVSPSLRNGGFFEEGEELIRLDPTDYELALTLAELQVTRASRLLEEEKADARVSKREWERMGEGEASPLTLRVPQLAEAEANIKAAEANVKKAKRDLDRTRVAAPYAGRVRRKGADLGQFVSMGSSVATVYGTQVAEVRLPLQDKELAVLKLPLGAAAQDVEDRPHTVLSAKFAGATHEWQATIVRTEGEIDPTSRMVMAVAEIQDPYGQAAEGAQVPLSLGMFVKAKVRGVLLENVYVFPRTALRDGDQVYIVDDENRLKFIDTEIVRSEPDAIIVRATLPLDARVVITPLEIVTAGMVVTDHAQDPIGEPDTSTAPDPEDTQ
jgi:RND family efflux transporter MFP subunit